MVPSPIAALLTTGDRANSGIIEENLGTPGDVFLVVFVIVGVPSLAIGIVDGVGQRTPQHRSMTSNSSEPGSPPLGRESVSLCKRAEHATQGGVGVS